MNLHKLLLTNNRCYKAGKTITPKGIMVHSTGANNPNLKRYVGPDDGLLGTNQYGNHWNTSNVDVCVHAFIGKLADGTIATYQTLPWNWRAWHCGGSGNNTHISFEICEDGLTDASYFAKVYQEAVELCAYLCKLYSLDPIKNIVCHSEGYKLGIASGHSDVMHWFPKHGKSMDTFRAAVKAQMRAETSTVATPEGWTKINGKWYYYLDGSPVKNQLVAGEGGYTGHIFWCGGDGAVATNTTITVEGHTYTADEAGRLTEIVNGPENKEEIEVNAEKRYEKLGDVAAKTYRTTLDKLVEKGIIKGREGSGEDLVLDLGEDAVRLLVYLDRAGVFET